MPRRVRASACVVWAVGCAVVGIGWLREADAVPDVEAWWLGLVLVADQARRRPTAELMLDLDGFRQVNTRLGHLGANEVLTPAQAEVDSPH